jgi:hypothetical protein
MSSYLNYHFSGDIVLSTQTGVEDSYLATKTLSDYLLNLDIDNSLEKEIENIGLWIGYPRPYVPDELLVDNAFLFYDVASYPTISTLHGFSSLADPLTGGRLISLLESASKLPLDIYRPLLKVMAFIKRNGWTLYSLDKMLFTSGVNYVITWEASNDLLVTFDSEINPVYTFIFDTIINKFSTLPRITLTI